MHYYFRPCSFAEMAEAFETASSMDDLWFENDSHRSSVLESMKYMFDNRLLVDVTICVNDRRFYCHRNVLAATSPYFRAMFTTSLLESHQNEIHIHEVDIESVVLVIDYAYTGSVRITKYNAQNLLVAASIFQITPIFEACARFMETQLEVANCVGIHYFAQVRTLTSSHLWFLVTKCAEWNNIIFKFALTSWSSLPLLFSLCFLFLTNKLEGRGWQMVKCKLHEFLRYS